MRRVAILVGTAVAVAAVWLWPSPVGAASPDAVGWWNKLQSSPVPGVTVPTPPTAPADGLYVANDPSGPTAISALRYAMEPSQTGGRLTLTVADASTTAAATIAACPVTEVWDQAANGAWANRAQYDCSTQVVGTVADDGQTVTWELTAAFMAFNPDFLDVALVPTGAAPFQVGFERPGDAAFTPATTATPSPGFVPDPVPSPAPSPVPAPVAPASPPRSVATPTPSTPADVVAAPPPAAAAQPEQSSGGARTRIEPTVAADDQGERLWATVALILLGLGMFALSGRMPQIAWARVARKADTPPPAPTGHLGGIGRFARPRAQPPTRLV